MPKNDLPEELIDTRAAAPIVGLKPSTLTVWRCIEKEGQPPYVRVGRNIRYRPSVLREWVASREHVPTAKN